MANDEEIRQPATVSKSLANYLDMTTPRSRARKRRPLRRDEQERTVRRPIGNPGLNLQEGNDFA